MDRSSATEAGVQVPIPADKVNSMNDQPDLFSITDDDVLTYNGTTGAVHQPASQERAQKEAKTGIAKERARLILQLLEHQPNGMTWKQLGAMLNLHHGQISGALSNLHKSGHVFMLQTQRDRCHPYCHANWRINYRQEERIDQPTQTKAGKRKDDLEQLLQAVTVAIAMGRITDSEVIRSVNQLKETE